MLELNDISFSYPGVGKPIIDGLSMEISPGETVAIVGPNGCGKTTLTLIIAGIIRPDSGCIEYEGLNYSDGDNLDAVRRDIGFLFQDPEDGILTTSVEREIAFGPENHGYAPVKIRDKINKIADEFDLREILKRPLDELSGGELERTAFAGAISFDPRILILDEPESYLDFEGKRKLFNEIERNKQNGTAIIHVTQSSIASSRADKIISLGVVEKSEGGRASSTIPEEGKMVLEIEDLTFSFDGKPVLSNVNFGLKEGESIAILGQSGVGKTTLARLAAGLYEPDSGEIKSHGRCGISFQFPARQLFADKVLDDVAFGPKSIGLRNPEELAFNALHEVGLNEDCLYKSPFELSEGEQRLAGLAGVLAIQPSYIFFDEPTAALDGTGKMRFMKIVETLLAKGVGVAIITHDLEMAKICCRKALVIDRKGRARPYSMEEILSNRELRRSSGIGTESDLFGGELCD